MRNVAHLLGVEFIHDLYNRYLPRINSIRFRNTIIVWKNGIINSFAPQEEWDMLEKWLGEKFIRCDPILLREVKKLVNSKSDFLDKFLKSFPKNLTKIDNVRLGLLLLDLQTFTLGELYRVNLVQIEHALSSALLKLLQNYIKDETKRQEVLSYIVAPRALSEFQKERQRFLKIVKLGQKMGVRNPIKNKKLYRLLYDHFKKYAYLNCAYGEQPKTMKDYINEYKQYFSCDLKIFDVSKDVRERFKKRKRLLKQLKDQRIAVLADCMSRVGVFRDKNKAKLGNTIRYRLMILDEIARRKLEKRENLDYYLLNEILNLLAYKEKLPSKIIKIRKSHGITIYRHEYLENGAIPLQKILSKDEIKVKYLRGICASPGVVIGKCKVVLSTKDISKINEDDILVAMGTDFNLLDGIYKAKGVITEEGGLLSHAAIVCREMRKPCCISVKDATRILKNKKVKLDATNGEIFILD